MAGITYDAAALVAAERGDRRMGVLHRRTLEAGKRPTVPAAVLAQVWRGGPQAALSRVLSGCSIEPLDEQRARAVGVALGRSKTSDVVDASVVIGAIARGDMIVTADVDDVATIAAALGARVEVVPI
jgi:hypothetical protein